MKLINNQQLLYTYNYSFEQVEQEILKTYIKTWWANEFIKFFKLYARTIIFFIKKSDSTLCLCVNYQSFNNLTIKNEYLLLWISELLNLLEKANYFT